MIVSTFEPMNVGERRAGWISDNQGVDHPMPFLVLRVATKEEYIQSCKEADSIPDTFTPEEWNRLIFYEISVD